MDVEQYARWVLAPPRPDLALRPQESYFVCVTPRSGLGLPTDVEPRPLTVKMDRNRCRPG